MESQDRLLCLHFLLCLICLFCLAEMHCLGPCADITLCLETCARQWVEFVSFRTRKLDAVEHNMLCSMRKEHLGVWHSNSIPHSLKARSPICLIPLVFFVVSNRGFDVGLATQNAKPWNGWSWHDVAIICGVGLCGHIDHISFNTGSKMVLLGAPEAFRCLTFHPPKDNCGGEGGMSLYKRAALIYSTSWEDLTRPWSKGRGRLLQ